MPAKKSMYNSKKTSKIYFDIFYSMFAYGAMMALAGLVEDSALDSHPSSCAFNWDPEKV